jgi:hypothetical protein
MTATDPLVANKLHHYPTHRELCDAQLVWDSPDW